MAKNYNDQMKNLTVKNNLIILLLIALLAFYNCAVNHYTKAEMFMNDNKYELALQEYLSIIKRHGRHGVKKNTRAYVGAAISYNNLGKYKKCMKICRTILKHDPYNGAALYYLGNSLEKLGMVKLAMSCYRQYPEVTRKSPYHSFLRARMNILIHKRR